MDSLTAAFLAGIWAFIAIVDNYGAKLLIGIRPLVAATVTGILLGDPATGLTIGVTMELMSLGILPIGGAVPPDFGNASIVATALAILARPPDPLSMVVLSIPAAFLAMQLEMLANTVNVGIVRRAEACASEPNPRCVETINYLGWIPFGLSKFVPTFLIVWLGAEAVKRAVETLPPAFFTALGAVALVLPALGLGLLLQFLRVEKYVPWFALGLVVVSLLNNALVMGLVTVAVLIAAMWRFLGALDKGLLLSLEFLILTFLISQVVPGTEPLLLLGMATALVATVARAARFVKGVRSPGGGRPLLGTRDLLGIFLRLTFGLEASFNYERMQAVGYLQGILPGLRKVYGEDGLKDAMKTHLEFFNTNPVLAPLIAGVDLAVEEREKSPSLAHELKIGLMGAFAGLGDSLLYFLIGGLTILGAVAIAKQGAVWAAFIPIMVLTPLYLLVRLVGLFSGYRGGLSFIESLSKEGRVTELRRAAEVAGSAGVGALVPVVFNVTSPYVEGALKALDKALSPITVSSVFGAAVGVVLTALATYLVRRGWTPTRVLLLLVLLGLILGGLGVITRAGV